LKCITCGTELHPERAAKYNYCMAPECQEKNARGMTIAVVGMNKSAEEFVILDDRTKADLASGKYHDQRRGSFGTSAATPAARAAATPAARAAAAPAARAAAAPAARAAAPPAGAAQATAVPAQRPARRPGVRPQRRTSPGASARTPWTAKQERLALLYNEQGLRPAEIADKLGVSSYLATQIILAAKNRGKL
jgi:hypothetical protein